MRNLLTELFLFAALLRGFLIIYGHWHDLNVEVKYTDIDYHVFSDAAEHVYQGRSPYERPTYRYTPLLAFLMLPNSCLHKYFGKLFFSLCDLLVAVLIYKILKAENSILHKENKGKSSLLDDKQLQNFVLVWLFNPLTLTISTRGNAESFQACLVLGALLCILKKQNIAGGILYGLAVHFKIYPVIYGLPIILFLARDSIKATLSGKFQKLGSFLADSFKTSFSFVFSSGITLITVTWLMYQW